MIFLKDMKNLKVYNRPFFLPTQETDPSKNRKTGSMIYLLTPNRKSSLNLMMHPLAVNKLRYQSYYLERDLTYFISKKVMNNEDTLEESYIRDYTVNDIIDNGILNEYNVFHSSESHTYNIEKFDKTKVLYITGYSGGGKSTLTTQLGERLKNKNLKVEEISLDLFQTAFEYYRGLKADEDNLRIYNNLSADNRIKKFFADKTNLAKIRVCDYSGSLTMFFLYLERTAKKENTAFIVEGIQIGLVDPLFFKERPLIIVGTSYIKSYFRRYKRDVDAYDADAFKDMFQVLRMYNSNNDQFSKLEKTMNESYLVEEAPMELPEEFLSKITYSGYDKDVKVLSQIFGPEEYFDICNELEVKDVPKLKLVVGDFPSVDEYFSYNVEEWDGNKIVTVHVPRYKSNGIHEYTRLVINTITKAIVLAVYPKTNNSILPSIFADTITDGDTKFSSWGEKIFSKISQNTFNDLCENGSFNYILDILKEDYPYLTINDIREDYSPITMNNLNDKFKYATTTKFKIANSRRSGRLRRISNKIQFAHVLDIPEVQSATVGLASAPSESANIDYLNNLTEGVDYFKVSDDVVLVSEDAASEGYLKRYLFKDRIKQRQQLLDIYEEVKLADPEIKFAYPELDRYRARNLFVDLSYYNQVFFKNNQLTMKRGFELYLELIDKLINDKRMKQYGYSKKTIFIPVLDWDKDPNTSMWLYREDINPISVIYELMFREPQRVRKVFGNTDIIFFDKNRYFKINFSELSDINSYKSYATKFKNFIATIESKKEFSAEDKEEVLSDTPEAIKTAVFDKINTAKGVDLTSKVTRNTTTDTTAKETPKPLSDKEKEREKDLERLANYIDKEAEKSTEEEIIDKMDDNNMIKDIIISMSGEDDSIKITPGRAARINKLANEFLDKDIKGKTVKQLLEENPSEESVPETALNIASPNQEWKHMTYMNFDKNYDLDRDIVACFNHFHNVSMPIGIRNISVKDTSTSEDRVETYTVECEGYNNKRFTIKLDIPILEDNRFLLRGNDKIISTQFLNMPILKTDLEAAQIITNYMKIFIYTYKSASGRTNPMTSRVLKALNKYDGTNLKIVFGDNSRICNKYELPIDYIDISSVINTIIDKKNKVTFYFNQDEIRELYKDKIDTSLGIPFAYDEKSGEIIYYSDNASSTVFASKLWSMLMSDTKFDELVVNSKPTVSGTYSQCSILNTTMPLVLVASWKIGLNELLKRAGIEYEWKEKLDNDTRNNMSKDWIKFEDGYLVYTITYASTMLLNGLRDCPTESYTMGAMDNKGTYIEFLDYFGGRGRLNADGLDNFYDCLIDPITKEVMNHYGLPDNIIDALLYANALMCDNKYIKHTDTSTRRIRRNELVAAYTYEVLSMAYGKWATEIRRGREDAKFLIRQDAVIVRLLQSPISQDDSINSALGAIEETNNVSFKGKGGLNNDRSYSLDKRTYDSSMINVLGASTGFSGNVGITRQATIDMNVEGVRGYIKQNNSPENMNTANTLTAAESLVPFEANHDDNTRVSMTHIQTSKHAVRTAAGDPLLITSGSDEAVPYLTTDKFAFKAKKNGKVTSITNDYMIVTYTDGSKEYVKLSESVEKNSDGGYYIPLKLDIAEGIKVGTSVKENQILAYDKSSFSNNLGESDNIAYNVGKLAKVAIMNSDEGFEDSGVCTEKISEELATMVIYKYEHVIEKASNVFDIKKIGDSVNVGDNLLVWQDPYDDEDANMVSKVLGTLDVSELGRRTIKSDTTGVIKDIKIYRTCDIDDEMSESLRKIVNDYERPIKQLKKALDAEGVEVKDLPATYKLEPTGKLKKADDALYFEFYVEHIDKVGLGDKITYFAANKAVEKNVIPKGKEPYTDFRPNEEVSALLSVSSINKRMVTSIMLNGALNKLMIELDRSVKDIAGIPYDPNEL